MTEINSEDINRIIQAILKRQNKIEWKPAKSHLHLMKRIRLGHLQRNATIEIYEAIIHQVLMNSKANVYVYRYGSLLYPTVTSIISEKLWLVMMGMDSILETAFPPENPNNCLNNQAFVYLGKLEDLLV